MRREFTCEGKPTRSTNVTWRPLATAKLPCAGATPSGWLGWRPSPRLPHIPTTYLVNAPPPAHDNEFGPSAA